MTKFLSQCLWNRNKESSKNKKFTNYFVDGLKGYLLMCHGIVDQNVHFQDIAKVSKRLIEIGKNNWELAPYPMENHDFEDPSSWTDEYKRIYKLFEEVLKK